MTFTKDYVMAGFELLGETWADRDFYARRFIDACVAVHIAHRLLKEQAQQPTPCSCEFCVIARQPARALLSPEEPRE